MEGTASTALICIPVQITLKLNWLVCMCYSPQWMAPENWSKDDNHYPHFYCQKNSDIFSVGMVLWELSDGTGALPWGNADIFEIRNHVLQQKNRPLMPAGTPPDFASLIENCWRDDPMHRPAAAEVFFIVQNMANKVC